jgi:predicted nucleotidyltransferase
MLYFCPGMTTKEQILTFLSLNKDLLREKFHVIRIGLFGSYARGDQNKDSDIDFLIEFEDNTENLYEIKRQLKKFIREKLNMEVDICREKYIKPRFKKSILKEAIYAE